MVKDNAINLVLTIKIYEPNAETRAKKTVIKHTIYWKLKVNQDQLKIYFIVKL